MGSSETRTISERSAVSAQTAAEEARPADTGESTAGIPSPPVSQWEAPDYEARLYAAQVDQLYEQAPEALYGALFAVLVVSAALWQSVPHTPLLAWCGLILLLNLVRHRLRTTYLSTPVQIRSPEASARKYAVYAALSGLVWGAGALWLIPLLDPLRQALFLIIVGGLCGGTVLIYSPVRSAYIPFVALGGLPLALAFILQGASTYTLLAGIILAYSATLIVTGERMHAVTRRNLSLQFDNRLLSDEIDRRTHMEAALRSSQERFRNLAEATADWIWECDVNGTVIYASPRIADLLGYQPAEIMGRSRLELLTGDDVETVKKAFEKAFTERTSFSGIESLNRHKDGRPITLETTGMPFSDERGSVRGFRCIDRDLSQRKKALELLVQSERLKATAQLSSGVAHNFNNLLQIIVSGIRLAFREMDADKLDSARVRLEQIQETALMSAETVKSLQNFAHGYTDSRLEEWDVFDLSSTAERAIEMAAPLWQTEPEQEGRDIVAERDLTPGCRVHGKENELFEVVVNLLKNAAEAMPHGGAIRVSTAKEDDRVVLRVSDNGVGIANENLAKVFQPFFTTKGVQGTGMGLSGSFGIVRRHGGQITAESKPGHGSIFTVLLPAAREPQAADEAVSSESMSPLRILLIDDHPMIVRMLKAGLERHDQTVWGAYSGREGLTVFEREEVDAIVSDLGMPEMNGRQVAKAVKELCEQTGRKKPVFIILTGWGDVTKRFGNLEDLGVDAVVQKPMDAPNLMALIHKILDQSV
jgi:PAS domain S-box-containing protein